MQTIETSQQSNNNHNTHKGTTAQEIFSLFAFSPCKDEGEKKEDFGTHEIYLHLPNWQGNATLIYESDKGPAGCHGVVVPAQLVIDGHTKRVQVKHFFEWQSSDRAEDDDTKVDPNKEAQNSYDRFVKLQKLGFRTCPFFGITTVSVGNRQQKVLIMEDLTYDDSKELIDPKDMRKNDTLWPKIEGSKNFHDMMLRKLQDALRSHIHGLDLGNGTSDFYVYDATTNIVDRFVTDVSAVSEVNRNTSPAPVPDYKGNHPHASVFYELLREYVANKLRYGRETYNADKDVKLAKARFTNTAMQEKILLIKYNLYCRMDDIKTHGEDLSADSPVAHTYLQSIDHLLYRANSGQIPHPVPNTMERFLILENADELKDLNQPIFSVEQFVKPVFWDDIDIHTERMDIKVVSKARFHGLHDVTRCMKNAFIDPRSIEKIMIAPQGWDHFDKGNKPLIIWDNPDLSEREIHVQKSSWEKDRVRICYSYSPQYDKYRSFEIAITGKEEINYVLQTFEVLKNEGWKVKIREL